MNGIVEFLQARMGRPVTAAPRLLVHPPDELGDEPGKPLGRLVRQGPNDDCPKRGPGNDCFVFSLV
jgi:hypothetical protein